MIQINKYLALAIVYIISIVGTVLFSWWFKHIDWSFDSESSESVIWVCCAVSAAILMFYLYVLMIDDSNK